MKRIITAFTASIAMFFSSCFKDEVDNYTTVKPQVDMREFFNGDVVGWGVLFDYQGRKTRHFTFTIKGTWDGNKGKMEEYFSFNDGEQSERIWMIDFSDDSTFKATAADVVGEAKGKQKGNAINLKYVLKVPYGKSTIDLDMDDWMYLVDENTLMNRTSMYKLGIRVGELMIYMSKK